MAKNKNELDFSPLKSLTHFFVAHCMCNVPRHLGFQVHLTPECFDCREKRAAQLFRLFLY